MMQEAAAIASDEVGYGLKDIPQTGVHWILTGWRLEVKRRPLWRAPLRLETWPRTMNGFFSERDFFAWHGPQEIARASSRWILVDARSGRSTRVSDAVRSAYANQLDTLEVFPGDPLPSNGKPSPDAVPAFETTVGRRDIDTNLHVNNLHYLDYAIEALPEEIYRDLPSTVEIVFRRQILLGTHIRCLYARNEDGKHQVEIQSESDGKIIHHAFVWLY